MATYRQIRQWVKDHYGFLPKSCWIAHVKEIHGLPRRDAPNRRGEEREEPCPPKKQAAIEAAFRHFGMLQ